MEDLHCQIRLIAIGAVLCLFSCKATPPLTVNQARSLAEEKLGQEVESYANSTGQYILFVQKPTTSPTALRFIVIHVVSQAIVETQTFMPGHVKWVTENSLEVLSVPGIVKSSEDLSRYIKIVHLRTSN
jgi:hypothetical protein